MAKLTNTNTSVIPTQRNIGRTVTSANQVHQGLSLTDTVMSIVAKHRKSLSSGVVKDMDKYTVVVGRVLGKGGVVMTLVTALKGIQPQTGDISKMVSSVSDALNVFNGTKFHTLGLKIKNFKTVLDKIMDLTTYIMSKQINGAAIEACRKNLDIVKKFYMVINDTFEVLYKMKVPKLALIKLIFVKLAMTHMTATAVLISSMGLMTPFVLLGIRFVALMTLFYAGLASLFLALRKVKVGPLVFIKLGLINMAMPMMLPILIATAFLGPFAMVATLAIIPIMAYWGKMNLLFNTIKKTPVSLLMAIKLQIMFLVLNQTLSIVAWGLVVGTILQYLKAAFGVTSKPILEVTVIFFAIKKMFDMIRKTKVGIFTTIKLRMIVSALKQVTRVLFRIAMLFYPPNALWTILMLTITFGLLKKMFWKIFLCGPLAIIAIPMMLVLTLALIALKLVLKLFIWVINGMVDKNFTRGVMNLILITGALTVLALMLLVMSLVAIKVVKSILWIIALLGAMTAIVVLVGAIGMIMYVLQPVFIFAKTGLISMLVMMGLILAVALMLKVIQGLDLDGETIKKNIQTVIDCAKTAIAAIFSGNGGEKKEGESGFLSFLKNLGGTVAMYAKLILSIPFLMYTFVSIGFLTMIAKNLATIQSLELDETSLTTRVGSIINVAKTVAGSINADRDERKKAKRGKKLLKTVTKSVESIKSIAETLNSISKIEIVEVEITSKVQDIFKLVSKVDTMMEQFNNRETINSDGKASRVMSWRERRQRKKQIAQNNRILGKMDKVVNTINNIGESLMSISEFKLDGDIKEKITTNITEIFGFIDTIETHMKSLLVKNGGDDEEGFSPWKMMKKGWFQNKKLNSVEKTIATVQSIGDCMNMLAEMKLTEETKKTVNDNVDVLFASVTDLVKKVEGKSEEWEDIDDFDIDDMQPFVDYINSIGTGMKTLSEPDPAKLGKNIDSYVRFVDKISTIDVAKLNTSATMFEKMADFSNSIQGNFDKLADTLNEKLMPVLEELKEVMTDIPEKLDKGFADTSASIGANQGSVSPNDVSAQVKRENPNMTESEVAQETSRRIREKQQERLGNTSAKLDELIKLLKGINGTVKVKTTM